MKKALLVYLLLIPGVLLSQGFTNGDLEGVVSGFGVLPAGWSSIPSSDINSQADPGGTSPDLTDPNGPGSATNGIIASPYSGNTCVAGSHGGTQTGTFFQEGIKQTVSGFTTGQSYTIELYQAIVKTQYCADTSGSWQVILDDNILGVTGVSISQEAFNSLNQNWEYRSISFTATSGSHEIKFLPMDDDGNQIATIGDQNGCLHMGMDAIAIQSCTNTSSSQSVTSCTSYTGPSNNYTWYTSGLYNDTIPNALGCDSVITIDLTINSVDPSVTSVGSILTANQSGAAYQWLDCDNNYAEIIGETNQSYTPTVTQSTAVEVTWNGCVDTSNCFLVEYTGIEELINDNKVLLMIVDFKGRETEFKPNTPLIFIYSDGTRERVMEIEN